MQGTHVDAPLGDTNDNDTRYAAVMRIDFEKINTRNQTPVYTTTPVTPSTMPSVVNNYQRVNISVVT